MVGSLQSEKIHAAGLIVIRYVYDLDGDYAVGNFQHCDHVYHDFPQWLVPRYGLAAIRSHDGALVVKKRTRQYRIHLEYGT